MKKFLKKRWRSIPVGIITAVVLVCVLTTGTVFAAYSFLSGQIDLTVGESMTVFYDWPGDGHGYIQLSDSFNLPISGVAGDSEAFNLKVCNAANNPINVATTLGGNVGKVTVTGLPNGSIPANSCWEGAVSAVINADASPGSYTVTIAFNRS